MCIPFRVGSEKGLLSPDILIKATPAQVSLLDEPVPKLLSDMPGEDRYYVYMPLFVPALVEAS